MYFEFYGFIWNSFCQTKIKSFTNLFWTFCLPHRMDYEFYRFIWYFSFPDRTYSCISSFTKLFKKKFVRLNIRILRIYLKIFYVRQKFRVIRIYLKIFLAGNSHVCGLVENIFFRRYETPLYGLRVLQIYLNFFHIWFVYVIYTFII